MKCSYPERIKHVIEELKYEFDLLNATWEEKQAVALAFIDEFNLHVSRELSWKNYEKLFDDLQELLNMLNFIGAIDFEFNWNKKLKKKNRLISIYIRSKTPKKTLYIYPEMVELYVDTPMTRKLGRLFYADIVSEPPQVNQQLTMGEPSNNYSNRVI
jgi:hypothetical protein